ncbi:MAG TPA: hypothetical protein V6D00_01465 [Pantanalinema sp.]
MTRTLGIDLGNAKVKYVLLEGAAEAPQARWAGYPLPFTPSLMPDRSIDFEGGLMATASAFLAESGLSARQLDRVVLVTSHFYSYPTFGAALHHTARMARALFEDRAFLVGADGVLYDPAEVLEVKGRQVLRFAATKFWGSAYLASKLVTDGLSVDVGTTSTDVIAIRGGAIEGGPMADPDGYNLSRLETQRLMWYGMTATPLDYVSKQASTGGRSYPLYPRMGATECLTRILDLVPSELAERHAYFGRYMSREAALSDLAQAFGLDRELLAEQELVELADNLHRQLIARVAEGIARVATQAGLGNPRHVEAAVMGLGKDALARPALLACGVPHDRIRDLEDVLGPELSAASTAYGAALKGLESLTGAPQPIG